MPHRELHRLPFAALWDGSPTEPDWLGDRFSLSVLPSASYLSTCTQLTRLPITHPGALVLGNPTGDLDGAEQEAEDVARLFNVDPLLTHDAVRSALLDASGPFGVIHVASHGSYDDTTRFFRESSWPTDA